MDTKQNETNGSLTRGLHHIMAPGHSKRWMLIDNCCDYLTRHDKHPFDLPVSPPELGFHQRDIQFVGARSTDMNVQVFLAHIRAHVGLYNGNEVTVLRVISTPYPRGERGQHHVFFEVQAGNINIISGETTDFSGGGNAARQELEDVFAVLSLIYKMEIQCITAHEVPLEKLYESAECFA